MPQNSIRRRRQKQRRTRQLEAWRVRPQALVAELAKAVATPSYDQDKAWYDSAAISAMFGALPQRLRGRRVNSVLLGRLQSYQDYLTRSDAVSDEEAVRQGANALHIYRLAGALRVLLDGRFDAVNEHSVNKELKDLFSHDLISYETSAYNISCAGILQQKTKLTVEFISEGKGLSPDLKVGDVAYVECKDLHPASRTGLARGLSDQLNKASRQLAAAQGHAQLDGVGICIDVPIDYWPLAQPEWDAVRGALQATHAPDFIFVTLSGVKVESGNISYPLAVALVTQDAPNAKIEALVSSLNSKSFRLASTGFDEIER